jgi:hypothetical protein
MRMAKATERDIDAAGSAMGVLNSISSGYYPARENEQDTPTFFDEEDPEHLRRFYDEMKATLNAAPGWPGRVIGGMCYVILYDANQIVDPNADTLELHPRFLVMDANPGTGADAPCEAAEGMPASHGPNETEGLPHEQP